MSKSEPLVSSLNRLFKTNIKMLPLSLFFLPMSNPIYQQCLLLLPSTYVPDPATSHHLCPHGSRPLVSHLDCCYLLDELSATKFLPHLSPASPLKNCVRLWVTSLLKTVEKLPVSLLNKSQHSGPHSHLYCLPPGLHRPHSSLP